MLHTSHKRCCIHRRVFADSKLDSKNQLGLLPELADLHNCNNTLYFEARRHEDLYMWVAKTPNGPSIKLHVQNIHTMDELKMTGNCLKGSRGLLSFDKAFEETEWGRLTKELFTHVSGCAPSRTYCQDVYGCWSSQGIWRPSVGSEDETVHRPHPDIFNPGFKDLVP